MHSSLKKGIPVRKRWSQNFLKDENIALKIVQFLKIPSPSMIIEIGAGKGILTKFLLQKADTLIAIEIDPLLVNTLAQKLDYPSNLQILEKDILDVDLAGLIKNYHEHHIGVIGNLPYHITSPIIFKIIDSAALLQQAVFMVQKEVGLRISAEPGSKQYGIISVFCQFYADVKYLFTVPAHLFYPKPKVDSGVIRFSFIPGAEKKLKNPVLFREIVRQTFGQRRKMLRNTLSILFPQSILNHLRFDLSRRPETVAVTEFTDIANQLHQIITNERYGQINSRH